MALNGGGLRRVARAVAPPIMVDLFKGLRRRARPEPFEWEYIPGGWPAALADRRIKGWDVPAIGAVYESRWARFVADLEGPLPLGLSPESDVPTRADLLFHNILITFGYALALSTRHASSITMLDWGGGMGHYYLISRALLPDLAIDYHCKDVPALAARGRAVLPGAHFYTDDACLTRRYDFILASGSLQYARDWAGTFEALAGATAGYLFVTRLPVVQRSPSFVVVQRPYRYGYNTEYAGWCLNRDEFLARGAAAGLSLIREFVIGEQPLIHGAPEQCAYRGYLFHSGQAGGP